MRGGDADRVSRVQRGQAAERTAIQRLATVNHGYASLPGQRRITAVPGGGKQNTRSRALVDDRRHVEGGNFHDGNGCPEWVQIAVRIHLCDGTLAIRERETDLFRLNDLFTSVSNGGNENHVGDEACEKHADEGQRRSRQDEGLLGGRCADHAVHGGCSLVPIGRKLVGRDID